jgi:phosphoribosylanthranilate isomerase
MTWIKICGISDIESAVAAAQAGADYLGMVFAPSRRQVSPESALKIVTAIRQLKDTPKITGVFVNTPATEVNQIAAYCKLDWAQLSGDETLEYGKEIQAPLIKVFHIDENARHAEISLAVWKAYRVIALKQLICLLDSAIEGTYGGTGVPLNLPVARAVAQKFSVMIAGGLRPDNVADIIKQIKPWGVDVSSGVETDGKKDVRKIKSFIENVRKTDFEITGGKQID